MIEDQAILDAKAQQLQRKEEIQLEQDRRKLFEGRRLTPSEGSHRLMISKAPAPTTPTLSKRTDNAPEADEGPFELEDTEIEILAPPIPPRNPRRKTKSAISTSSSELGVRTSPVPTIKHRDRFSSLCPFKSKSRADLRGDSLAQSQSSFLKVERESVPETKEPKIAIKKKQTPPETIVPAITREKQRDILGNKVGEMLDETAARRAPIEELKKHDWSDVL